jgi:hypothetical protein
MSFVIDYAEGVDLATLVEESSNRDVLAYLRAEPSCHGDVGQALLDAAKDKCGEWTGYSPSFASFRYVALVTRRRVFALAHDMRYVCFRLPKELVATAVETGGKAATDIGPEWVRLELFRASYPAVDLPFWALRAYDAARSA